MDFAFIKDLDDFFCEKYANYDRICAQKGYVMPVMQSVKKDEFGRDVAYTLPSSTLRLSAQKNKEEILKNLKAGLFDEEFSFSFRPLGFFERIKTRFSKTSFPKVFPAVLQRKNLTIDDVEKTIPLETGIWKRIRLGKYAPTKNLIFSIALKNGLSDRDTLDLLKSCGFSYRMRSVKDVVAGYLLHHNITNPEMIASALAEYKITTLFL